MRAERVIVIGGGTNGLCAAILLAKQGREVVVCEARDRLGGLAARERFGQDGEFTVPGLLHDTTGVRPWVQKELGLGLERIPNAPLYAPVRGGDGLWLTADGLEGDFAAADVERLASFRAFIERVRPAIDRLTSEPPPDPLGPMWPLVKAGWGLHKVGERDLIELLRIAPSAVADWMRDSFDTERLRAAIAARGIIGEWLGPWSAHSSTCLLLRLCADRGEVAGGPAGLSAALVGSAKSAGVELRTSAPVEMIRVESGEAVGVVLAGGETIDARCVVATCDPKQTFQRLLPADWVPSRLASAIRNIRARGTTAKLHYGIVGPLEAQGGRAITHMQVGETLDELERAFDGVKYDASAERPFLDVRVPSVADPSLAPAGHHVVSVLCHFVPYHLDGGWTEEATARLARAVTTTLDSVCHGFSDRIVAREVITPAEIASRYRLTGGQIYHGEHAPDQLAFMRPVLACGHYKTPIPGLVLAGSGSHPGGGLTLAPAAIAVAHAFA